MAANVRYRGTFYNTTVTGTGSRTMKVEILDTEAVAQVINMHVKDPDESFEGLSEDLKPGVYTSSFSFQMILRSSPKAIGGITYGITDDLVTDILTAPEGRFLVRLLIDDVMVFIGPMIYDQCSYEDDDTPWMNITAVDGLTRLLNEPYVSEVGQIVYKDCTYYSFIYSNTPSSACLSGSEWVLISHSVESHTAGSDTLYRKISTYARRQIYAKSSPGTGWVDQGEGLWAKPLTYTNEVIEETVNVSYMLSRDIDDDRHRTVAEYFKRAMAATQMSGEYPDPDVMYDVTMLWYEHSMVNFTDDPTTMMRLHEGPLIGKTWAEVLTEICRPIHMRVYSAQGRYHFEQIPARDEATFTRYIYKADGTSAGTAETADLDLDFATLEIQPETGGMNEFLAPFSYVEAIIQLDRSDLLEGVRWDVGQMGMKYLGRIKRTTGTQRMVIRMSHAITSTFDPAILAVLNPNVVNSLCKHTVRTYIMIRLTNVETGTVYYLNPDGNAGTWDTTVYSFERTATFGVTGVIFSNDNYGYTRNQVFLMSSDDIPDPEDAMYDVHVSVTFTIEWDNNNALNMWEVLNPTKHWHILSSRYPSPSDPFTNSMRFYSDVSTDPFTESPDTIAQEKVYFVENENANSLPVRVTSLWADTNQFEKAIQIWNGTIWVNSAAWSIGGIGTPMEILQLLVNEIMSLRMVPRHLYNGSFVSALPSPDNRFLRGTEYFLPLSCHRDTGYDTYSGSFLQIAKTTPPAGGTFGTPYEGQPLPGLTSIGDTSPDAPTADTDITLETNEAITAGSTHTVIDIINTAEAFIQAGTSVTLIHPTSGVQEVVILAEDINPDSTTMTIDSHTFGFAFPDASMIVPNVDDGLVPTSLAQYYYFYKEGYSASEIHAPTYNFPNPEGYGAMNINKRVKVFRNSIRIYYNGAPGSNPTKRKSSYYIDHVAKKWKFWLPLADETIEIEAF